MLRTLAPLTRHRIATTTNPFDLHVLSTPPAFVLSQNQTLRKEFVSTLLRGGENLTVHNLTIWPSLPHTEARGKVRPVRVRSVFAFN